MTSAIAEDVTLTDIQLARTRVASWVRRTPLSLSTCLSKRLGTNVYAKLELFQKTGSFKVRGAFNKAISLEDEDRAPGLVTVSGGNHAQAVSYVASKLNIPATIVMPQGAPEMHVTACRGYGATVEFAASGPEAFRRVEELKNAGQCYIHPFDDPDVIAGQGTLGLEILEDTPHLTDLIVPVGGGGLISGVATTVKSLKPDVRVWGVETEGADCMSRSLAAGKVESMDSIGSVARSLGAPAPSEHTLEIVKQLVEQVIVVPDAEALAAQDYLLDRLKVLAEPAASCAMAAADRLKARFSADRHVVLILSGGNAGARLARG